MIAFSKVSGILEFKASAPQRSSSGVLQFRPSGFRMLVVQSLIQRLKEHSEIKSTLFLESSHLKFEK